jgi:ABC-type transporter Mla maintaining outer membrane lipid asymmetry permease subunit MlaE
MALLFLLVSDRGTVATVVTVFALCGEREELGGGTATLLAGLSGTWACAETGVMRFC